MIVLIFGTTAMANRLEYYLQGYASSRGMPMAVHRVPRAENMHHVQDKVWTTYTSASASGRPTIVVNAHELEDLDLNETNAERAWKFNTTDAAAIAYAARTAEIPLIQLSTEHVFRGNSGPYGPEQEPTNPLNVYGATKWYAEQITQKIHPYRESDDLAGTCIVRTSGLYGFETLNTPPPFMTHIDDKGKPVTSGIIKTTNRTTPSFVGEAAFLLARNICHMSGFSGRIVHIAPDIPSTTWGNYLHGLGCDVILQDKPYEPGGTRVGESLGLRPSPGWHLPKDPTKSFNEFLTEIKYEEYTRYWNK